MLHDWNSLLVWYWRIHLIDVDPEVNWLILVAAFSLDDLHLVLEAENGPSAVALGIAGSIHGGVLSISLIVTIAIFGQYTSILILLVNKLTHVHLRLSTDIVKLLGSWIGLDLIMRSARRIPLRCNYFWPFRSTHFFLLWLIQRLVAGPVLGRSSSWLTVLHLVLVCLA